jgi:superoxide dismutase
MEETATSEQGTAEWWANVDREIKALVGQPLERVQKDVEGAGWLLRITQRDGKFKIITCDVKENRINVSVKDGIVTGAWRG